MIANLKLRLKEFNSRRLLAWLMFCGGIIITTHLLFAPWYPGWRYNLVEEPRYREMSQESQAEAPQAIIPAAKPVKLAPHRLIIGKIEVNAPIVEAPDERGLDRGAWHVPASAFPGVKGNTVITGHRFKYLPPNNLTFYNLDKLKVGDKISIVWDDKRFEYLVAEIKVVLPDDVSITKQDNDERLTLYTCEPLWSQEKRLVVIALPK